MTEPRVNPSACDAGPNESQFMDAAVRQQILFIQHLTSEGQLELALDAAADFVGSLSRYEVKDSELKVEAKLMLAELRMLVGQSSLQELRELSASIDDASLTRTAARLEFDLATAMLHEAEYSALQILVQSSSKDGANAGYLRRILCLVRGDHPVFVDSSDVDVTGPTSDSLAVPLAVAILAAESLRASQLPGLESTSEEILSVLCAGSGSAVFRESCVAGVYGIAITDHLVAQGRLEEAQLFLDKSEEFGRGASYGNRLAGSLSRANLALALKDFRTAENLILDLDDAASGPRSIWLRSKRILVMAAAGLGREQHALRIFRDFVNVAAGQRMPFPDTLADILTTVVRSAPRSASPQKARHQLDNLIGEIEPYLGGHSTAIIEAKLKAAILLFEGGGLRQALKRLRLIVAVLRFDPLNDQPELLREATAYMAAARLMLGTDSDLSQVMALPEVRSHLEAANLADQLIIAGDFSRAREVVEQTNPCTSLGLVKDRLILLSALAKQGGRALDDEGLKAYNTAVAETSPGHYASLQTYLLKFADAFEAAEEFHTARGLFRSLLAHIPPDEASILLLVELRMAGNLEASGDHYDAAKHYRDLANRFVDSPALDPSGLFDLNYREALNWCLNFSFERALSILESLRTRIDSYTGTIPREDVVFWLARSFEHLKRPREAADCYEELVELLATVPSRSDLDFPSRAAYSAGVNLEQCGKYEAALRYYDIARSGYAALHGDNHAGTARAALRQSFCRRALGLPTSLGTVELMPATADSPA